MSKRTWTGTLRGGLLDGRTIRVRVFPGVGPWIVTHHGSGHRDDVRTFVVECLDGLEAFLAAHGSTVTWSLRGLGRTPTWIGPRAA